MIRSFVIINLIVSLVLITVGMILCVMTEISYNKLKLINTQSIGFYVCLYQQKYSKEGAGWGLLGAVTGCHS